MFSLYHYPTVFELKIFTALQYSYFGTHVIEKLLRFIIILFLLKHTSSFSLGYNEEHQNQAYPLSADTLASPPVSNRQAEGRYTSTSPPATRILGESNAAAENPPANVIDPDYSADIANSMGNGSRAEESNGTSRALVLIEQPDGDIAPLNPSEAAAWNVPRRRRSYAEQSRGLEQRT